VLLLLAVGAGGWLGGKWSVTTINERPAVPPESSQYAKYTVKEGIVGDSRALLATARWPIASAVVGLRSGTVTSVPAWAGTGQRLAGGETVVTVDLRPVVALSGEIPMFRDIGINATGADVTQLQTFLRQGGWLNDAGREDVKFGQLTRDAVRAWQESIGLPRTGIVARGDIVFLAALPRLVDVSVRVGETVDFSKPFLDLYAPSPEFRVEASQGGPQMASETPVVVSLGSQSFDALLGPLVTENGAQFHILHGKDGGAPCAEPCASVPLVGESSVSVEALIVAELSGPMVPSSAIGTSADGSTFVRLAQGDERAVRVQASANGLSIVSGVQLGEVVLIPTVNDER